MGFRLEVQDVFSITGRGTVVTGIEAFQDVLTTAEAGQQIGLLLDEVERNDVTAGDALES